MINYEIKDAVIIRELNNALKDIDSYDDKEYYNNLFLFVLTQLFEYESSNITEQLLEIIIKYIELINTHKLSYKDNYNSLCSYYNNKVLIFYTTNNKWYIKYGKQYL